MSFPCYDTLAKSLATCEFAEQCTLEFVIAGQCLLALCPGPAAPGTRNTQELRITPFTQGGFRFRFALEGAGQS